MRRSSCRHPLSRSIVASSSFSFTENDWRQKSLRSCLSADLATKNSFPNRNDGTRSQQRSFAGEKNDRHRRQQSVRISDKRTEILGRLHQRLSVDSIQKYTRKHASHPLCSPIRFPWWWWPLMNAQLWLLKNIFLFYNDCRECRNLQMKGYCGPPLWEVEHMAAICLTSPKEKGNKWTRPQMFSNDWEAGSLLSVRSILSFANFYISNQCRIEGCFSTAMIERSLWPSLSGINCWWVGGS